MKHPELLCKALRKNTQVIAIHEDLKELAAEAKEKPFFIKLFYCYRAM